MEITRFVNGKSKTNIYSAVYNKIYDILKFLPCSDISMINGYLLRLQQR